jgi:Zn-dependent peptidase ImmA (M78 family)
MDNRGKPIQKQPKRTVILNDEENFKSLSVNLILNGKAESALELLAKTYRVNVPNLRVGLPKKHKTKAYGTYTAKDQTISVLNSDILVNPFVILHEFYHHLRSKGVDKMHRGTEGNANKFAIEFLIAYQLTSIKTKGYIQ